MSRSIVNRVVEDTIPNKLTYSIMIDSFCREGKFLGAIDFLLASLEDGFSSDLVVRQINWLIKDEKLKEVLKMIE